MASVWISSIAERYLAILDDLAGALRTCPGELWEESLYPDDPSATWIPIAPDGNPIDDPIVAAGKRRAQGAVWRTAAHALFFADADLSAMESGWVPRPPFSPHDEDADVVPPTCSREQLLDHLDHCLRKVDEVFDSLTDDRAADRIAASHRHPEKSVGQMLVIGLVHLQMHIAQLRAFLVTRGVPWEGGRG